MIQNTDYSFVIASRLKELRDRKGLSFDRLSKELKEKYGISISSDSLMNYEVIEPNHSKAKKNLGMRIEYLRCLADFYGVSTDYIIGLSDIKSSDPTVEGVVKATGLSEDTVASIIALNDQIAEAILAERNMGGSLRDIVDKPFTQLYKPVAMKELITLLIDCVFSIKSIQEDYLSIHRTIESILILQDAFDEVVGNDSAGYSTFEDRVVPRPDYIRFKAHEICREIEQRINLHISVFGSHDYQRMKNGWIESFTKYGDIVD